MTLTTDNTPARLHPWLKELNALHAVYLVVMAIKVQRANMNKLDLFVSWVYVAYGYARDVWFNLTTANRIFDDRARELTVTARLKRYRANLPASPAEQERAALAAFLCDQVLDRGASDGEHC